MTHKNQALESKTILETAKAATLKERDDLRVQLSESLASGNVG